ncbi:MAG: hypothetical protein IPM95_08845 [Sphingobacteriales bacterium]|nr:hypothetical protein [Sphingobacteriales bacterium]
MRKIILIVVAIAALAGAWYLGKTTGKDCCKETGKAGELAAANEFPDGKNSKLRNLVVLHFEEYLDNYTYYVKVNNYEDFKLEIIKDTIQGFYYSGFFQSFKNVGSGNSESHGRDNPLKPDKTYDNNFTIYAVKDGTGERIEIGYYTTGSFKGQNLLDHKTNLVYQFVFIPKLDKVLPQKKEKIILPLQNPPINPIGPAPGPG